MNHPISYENWKPRLPSFTVDDDTKGAHAVLEYAYKVFPEDRIVYASSFGAEAIVLISLIHQVKPDAHIVFLDTDLHFPCHE